MPRPEDLPHLSAGSAGVRELQEAFAGRPLPGVGVPVDPSSKALSGAGRGAIPAMPSAEEEARVPPRRRPAARRGGVKPIFLVTGARCGSTLLRYLLDSHPEIVSPPELNLSVLVQHLVDVWMRTELALKDGSGQEEGMPAPALGDLDPEACRRARRTVDELMAHAAKSAGARYFCDKSLTTVDQLGVVSGCYPDASYIFLYRYPLDMIASGLEASRWGFNAFGFAPYVAATPGNFVAGLANYWIDRVQKMLSFEETCEVAHARIYYELLCDQPEQSMRDLLDFIGVGYDEGLIERTFGGEHGAGPGDYKIDFTHGVAVGSIGRGSSLPELLAPHQVERIDELLAALDYPSLAAARGGRLPALLGVKSQSGGDATATARKIAKLLDGNERAASFDRHRSLLPIELVIELPGSQATVVISQDGASAHKGVQDAGPGVRRVRCKGDGLLDVASGRLNLAQLMHEGAVRLEREASSERAPGQPTPRAVFAALDSLLRGARPS